LPSYRIPTNPGLLHVETEKASLRHFLSFADSLLGADATVAAKTHSARNGNGKVARRKRKLATEEMEEGGGEEVAVVVEEDEGDWETYDVKCIHAQRGKGKSLRYHVEWEGWFEWTWEPAAYLRGTIALVQWKDSGKQEWEKGKHN